MKDHVLAWLLIARLHQGQVLEPEFLVFLERYLYQRRVWVGFDTPLNGLDRVLLQLEQDEDATQTQSYLL